MAATALNLLPPGEHLVMSSSLEIPGPPKILFLDSTDAGDGQASDLAQRISSAIRRQGVDLSGPFSATDPQATTDLLSRHADANCLFFLAGGPEDLSSISRTMSSADRSGSDAAPAPRLIAIYTSQNPEVPERERVVGPHAPGTIVVISKPVMSSKEATLFFAEFFGELHTHCPDAISVAMVRFCFVKASRLAPKKAAVWT